MTNLPLGPMVRAFHFRSYMLDGSLGQLDDQLYWLLNARLETRVLRRFVGEVLDAR